MIEATAAIQFADRIAHRAPDHRDQIGRSGIRSDRISIGSDRNAAVQQEIDHLQRAGIGRQQFRN